MSLVALFATFPDEQAAIQWLEALYWPDGKRRCRHCESADGVQDVPGAKPVPCRCGQCGKYFSLRTGTVMERSSIPWRKRVIAAFLLLTHPKGVSSLQLHRDPRLGVKSAWFLLGSSAKPVGGRERRMIPKCMVPMDL